MPIHDRGRAPVVISGQALLRQMLPRKGKRANETSRLNNPASHCRFDGWVASHLWPQRPVRPRGGTDTDRSALTLRVIVAGLMFDQVALPLCKAGDEVQSLVVAILRALPMCFARRVDRTMRICGRSLRSAPMEWASEVGQRRLSACLIPRS